MPQEPNNLNSLFKYTFIGAVLFISAAVFTLAYFPNIKTLELSYTVIASVLGLSSVSLLYKAVKGDKNRLSQI